MKRPVEDEIDTTYLLRTRGYAMVPEFIGEGDLARLRSTLIEAIDSYRPRDESERSRLDRYNIHDLLVRDPQYLRLLDDSRLDEMLAPLLGEHWILYAFTASSLPPGSTNYARRIHVDSPRRVEGYAFNIGVMWALDAFTLDNGAPEFLPGSHHSDEVPSEAHFARYHDTVCCPPGALILFDARVFHRAGVNSTRDWRHALTLNACRSFMKQRLDWPRFLPATTLPQISPRLRRILGYDTRVPANLDEMFLPEELRLYKANQG